ncbi:MAG TPA: hypothetical protein VIC08_14810 [Cellvibrionaceae bacterium]
MREYVAICNHAMAKSKHKLGYRQAHKMSKTVADGANFRTIIYENNPSDTQAIFTLSFDAETPQLHLNETDSKGAREEKGAFTWKAPVSYLKDVVETRPMWYLENPAQLDWQWLKARADDTLHHQPPRSVLASGVILGAAAMALGFIAASTTKRKHR